MLTVSPNLAETIAARCEGQDIAALFPACAGKDLVRCLAGHAKARSSRGVNAAGGLCPAPGPPPPPPEPIDLHVVPLPADASAEPRIADAPADGTSLALV